MSLINIIIFSRTDTSYRESFFSSVFVVLKGRVAVKAEMTPKTQSFLS